MPIRVELFVSTCAALPLSAKSRSRSRLRSRPRRSSRTRRAGFTLIEVMAVMLILAILMVILVTQFTDILGVSKEKFTRVSLTHLQAAIGEYENQQGDYPRSSFTPAMGAPPNPTNIGAECLVVALFSKNFKGGGGNFEALLINTDQDSSKTRLTDFGDKNLELYELKDRWDNPIAYLHRTDYGNGQAYLTTNPEDGEEIESTVKARMNPKTGLFWRVDSFQLISAGADGRFGTPDDIVNWDKDG